MSIHYVYKEFKMNRFLKEDWKNILHKAWSIRLMLIAGLLSGIEVVFPLFVDAFPRGLFAALSVLFTGAAFVARILAQRNMSDGA